MKLTHAILSSVVATVALAATHADAAVLYAATAAGATGELYILNPATGAVLQDIGPLNDAAGNNYPVTGLAFHPTTGVLYGSTGNSNAATAARLVTINPATGLVTPVGSFNAGPTNTSGLPATMADIGFDPATNTLYGVGSIGGPQLYTINPATGQATLVGNSSISSTSGGGVAVSPAGGIYGTPTGSRFGTYNPASGAYTNITAPALPLPGAYGALDFDDAGVLYALNIGPGSPPATHLVTINPTTGAVTDLGPSATALDAIAFQVPEPASLSLLTLAATPLLARRRRHSR